MTCKHNHNIKIRHKSNNEIKGIKRNHYPSGFEIIPSLQISTCNIILFYFLIFFCNFFIKFFFLIFFGNVNSVTI